LKLIAPRTIVILVSVIMLGTFSCLGSYGNVLADEPRKNIVATIFANAADEARFMACYYNMKILEGACELFLMENSAPKQLTVAELIAKKCLKTEPKCSLNKTGSYIINIKGQDTEIKCPGHNKTFAEISKTFEELKKAGKLPKLDDDPGAGTPVKYTPAPMPVITDAKKSATLKLFLEVLNKCTHDASVTIVATNNEMNPPAKITQYYYYRDPANFRSDTIAAARKVQMVVLNAGKSWILENGGKLIQIPSQQVSEIISSLDLGSIVSNNIDAFDLTESKDKNNNILIYLINKKTGYMNTFVIDPKLKVFKRLCAYPRKGFLAIDNIYSAYKFGKLDDKVFAVPAQLKTGAAR